jgi:septal ring factor EnvC (AmiA/AmiB activator)
MEQTTLTLLKMVIPVVIFLAAQAILGLLWAGNLNSTINGLQRDIQKIETSYKEDIAEQQVMINNNDDRISRILTQLARTNTYLERSRSDIQELRNEFKQTNSLLRSYLGSK